MDRIHLKSPKNWINDPNGFIYYKGKYHLFYQHFPYAPRWGRMHWGHAVSDDLVNWQHLDIALYPSKTDDRSGCFSGSAIEHDDKMNLFYTGVNYQTEDPENINCTANDDFIAAQLMLTSEDGYSFDNISDKRTIIPPIADEKIGSKIHTRDPKIWRGKDAWYIILGSTVDNKGRFLIFRSFDLIKWEYANFCEKDNLGWMWECPDWFEVNGSGVVVFSPIGILDDDKAYDSATVCCLTEFDEAGCSLKMAENYQLFDYGIDLYAPQSTVDRDGNRVIIAWARMPDPVDGKWNGMMCIPRIVEVIDDKIFFHPHPNVKAAFVNKTNTPSCKSGYLLKTSLQNGDKINIGGYVIERENDIISTDRSVVFVSDEKYRKQAQTPILSGEADIEVYVDSNLIEVYVNGGEYVITSVVYGLTDIIIGEDYTTYACV